MEIPAAAQEPPAPAEFALGTLAALCINERVGASDPAAKRTNLLETVDLVRSAVAQCGTPQTTLHLALFWFQAFSAKKASIVVAVPPSRPYASTPPTIPRVVVPATTRLLLAPPRSAPVRATTTTISGPAPRAPPPPRRRPPTTPYATAISAHAAFLASLMLATKMLHDRGVHRAAQWSAASGGRVGVVALVAAERELLAAGVVSCAALLGRDDAAARGFRGFSEELARMARRVAVDMERGRAIAEAEASVSAQEAATGRVPMRLGKRKRSEDADAEVEEAATTLVKMKLNKVEDGLGGY
ncbi:hypothetical protein DFJ73DRAFT_776208 [Zopfochytrium polystomum]|nr:hypothetical protein DFJ73DRAFT_776208 [Zopfochytrium polystomum]